MNLSVDKRNSPVEFKVPRPYNNSYDLNRYVSGLSKRIGFLSFSAGKDSIASWLYMKETGFWDDIIPVYYYIAPGLEFIEESLTYFENFFDTDIIRLPSPNLIVEWVFGTLMTPLQYRHVLSKRDYFLNHTFDDTDNWIRADMGYKESYMGTGMRMYDGPNRLGVVRKTGGIKEADRKFMPIFDFKIADINTILKHHNCKIPRDYLIWGKSFDGMDYRFISSLKKHYPRDYNRMREAIPLLDLNIMRYDVSKSDEIFMDINKYK